MHKIITSILEIFGRLEEFGCVKSVLLFGKLSFKKKGDKEDFTVCKNKTKKTFALNHLPLHVSAC